MSEWYCKWCGGALVDENTRHKNALTDLDHKPQPTDVPPAEDETEPAARRRSSLFWTSACVSGACGHNSHGMGYE